MADKLQVPKNLSDEKALRQFLTELTGNISGGNTEINKYYTINPTTAIPMDTSKYDNHIKYDELFSLFDSSMASNYSEISYDSDAKIIGVDVWDTDSKVTKLFTKVINYDGDKVSSIQITYEPTSFSITKTFTYSGDSISSMEVN